MWSIRAELESLHEICKSLKKFNSSHILVKIIPSDNGIGFCTLMKIFLSDNQRVFCILMKKILSDNGSVFCILTKNS